MDSPPTHQAEEVTKSHCLPLAATCGPSGLNPFSPLAVWVSRSLQRARLRDGFVLRKPVSKEDLAKTAISWRCPVFGETGELGMEGLMVKGGVADDGSDVNAEEGESFSDSAEEERHGSSMSSESSSSEEPQSRGSSEQSPKPTEPLGFQIQRSSVSDLEREDESSTHQDDGGTDKPKPNVSDIDMMKERFSKLLLGEDMSGCGKGVCTALAISNAITNLCATIFGQLWRLEPLSPEKKRMWRREMDWLLCVSDHIVELIPSWQTFPDGSKVEVMTCRPRSDLYINLPALRKLDNMLFEILDGFSDPEFWYVDQGISAPNSNGSASFRRPLQHQEEKWWLPTPRVPPGGLHEKMRKQLQHKRECTNQILKAALAINSNALAEMEVPLSYLDSLPKNGRASLGDIIYRYITSVQFSPECLLDCVDLSSEYQALEIANRVETSIYVWRRSALAKPINTTNRAHHRSSWGMVKDLVLDAEKRELLADRAESLLLCLKQRFPGLTQTTLDMSKIQFNKDVGKSILESYSRVLESIAFNIIARIDDLIYVDDLTKQSDQFSLVPTTGVAPHKRVLIPYSVPVSSTPYTTAYTTPHFSPAPLVSPARGKMSPFISRKHSGHGFTVKKVLTDYLGVEVREKNSSKPVPSMNQEGLVP